MADELVTAAAEVVRVLHLEDSPDDAALAAAHLRHAGIAASVSRVDTRDAFVAALDEFRPDLILCDFNLPGFDGAQALALARERHPEIPVIMVSGELRDESAVEMLKAGARDFVLKDRLARLGDAVRRALAEAQAARAMLLAQQALRESEEKFRAIFDHVRDGVLLLDSETRSVWLANPSMEGMLGSGPGGLAGLALPQLVPAQTVEQVLRQFDLGSCGDLATANDMPVLRQDGGVVFMNLVGGRVEIGGRQYLLAAFRDATERRAGESRLRAQLEELQRWQAVNLDREDRVLELKREVNELSRRLDLPPRYASAN